MDRSRAQGTGCRVIRVCLHGAESTGKSVLADRLARHFACPWVPEYGRTYCEERGTDLTMADLIAIAEGQAEAVRRAEAEGPPLLILDTDQLMTAAWAQMLFGSIPAALLDWPKADLYLLFSPDVPWIDDGTRFFGENTQRQTFAALAEQVLVDTGVRYQRIAGSWQDREEQARRAITELAGRA